MPRAQNYVEAPIPREPPELLEIHPFSEVVRRLREEVTLYKDVIPGFRPYRRSRVTLEEISPDDLYPAALYLLNATMKRTRALRAQLRKQGLDPLAFTEEQALIVFNWGDSKITMSPPVVEESVDDGGKLVITDGLHRFADARVTRRKRVSVTMIRDIAAPLQPLPVTWEEVRRVDTVPPGAQKKRFRFPIHNKDVWMAAVNLWIADNYDRFLEGFDEFAQLGLMHALVEEEI